MKYYKYYLLSVVVILIDQIVKLLVHYNMELGEEFSVFGDWFKIHYTENPGMAFGIQIDWQHGKLLLTFFRLFAMVAIGYYIFVLAKKNVHQGLIWCVALILAGAIGNVIDSTFYGVFLENAPANVTTPWFHGKVVDMFYIDIWSGYVADWVPVWGGKHLFLWPIFNIADASIFIGISIILIRQKAFFDDGSKNATPSVEEDNMEIEVKASE